MPSIEQHIKQWKHNRDCARNLDRRFVDWQVSVAFYAALHAVDAVLTSLGVNISDHSTRNDAIRRNAALAGIRDKYLNLYRISKVTRYDADPDTWLPQQYLTVNDLISDLLSPIEQEVERLLKIRLSLPPLKVES